MLRLFMILLGARRTTPVILLATLALGACTAEEQPATESPRLVKVETVSAQPRDGMRFIGLVQSQRRADLSFEVGGLLEQVAVEAGQQVIKGQVLAQLDSRPAELRLSQARAQLAAQKENAAQKLRRLERNKQLLTEGSVAKSEVELSATLYRASQAQSEIAEAALQMAKRELDV